MLKKVFSVVILSAIILSAAPVQAENNFDLNKDFNSQIIFKSNIHNGRQNNFQMIMQVMELAG